MSDIFFVVQNNPIVSEAAESASVSLVEVQEILNGWGDEYGASGQLHTEDNAADIPLPSNEDTGPVNAPASWNEALSGEKFSGLSIIILVKLSSDISHFIKVM